MTPYWACAQLETNRERLALHCLELAGYQVYMPRIRAKPTARLRQGQRAGALSGLRLRSDRAAMARRSMEPWNPSLGA